MLVYLSRSCSPLLLGGYTTVNENNTSTAASSMTKANMDSAKKKLKTQVESDRYVTVLQFG